ncbi:hypothetical protein [Undibacterium sp.]|uniref:hypothetical protein n=1 Tax=Undibacterium sp. TaxID=1914977 RepID=UPI003750D47C
MGIAYYSVQIYGLRDRISLTRSAPQETVKVVQKMQLEFTMESTNVELIEGCRQLFKNEDKMQLSIHPDDSKKGILKVSRHFLSSSMQEAIDLKGQLRKYGCLQNDKDVFALKVLK